METIIRNTNSSRLNLQRQSFLGRGSDRVLGLTRIAIIGLGGGGSHIAQQSAHIGVGQYVLFDPDRIEDTNLNRLVGATAEDVRTGLDKVLIAKRTIKSVNRNASVVTKASRWQEHANLLLDCDCIFACVDSLTVRSEIETFARRYLIPLIDIGMDVHAFDNGYVVSGQVALSMPEMPCLRCMGLLNEGEMKAEAERYGAAGSRPQVVWPNGVLASTAVGCFMQLTTPWTICPEVPLLLEYDGNQQTICPSNKLPYLPQRCSHYSDLANLGDPFWLVEDSSRNQL